MEIKVLGTGCAGCRVSQNCCYTLYSHRNLLCGRFLSMNNLINLNKGQYEKDRNF